MSKEGLIHFHEEFSKLLYTYRYIKEELFCYNILWYETQHFWTLRHLSKDKRVYRIKIVYEDNEKWAHEILREIDNLLIKYNVLKNNGYITKNVIDDSNINVNIKIITIEAGDLDIDEKIGCSIIKIH